MGTWCLENSSSKNYLVFSEDDQSVKLDTVLIGMVVNNKIDGIIPFVFSQQNATRCVKYDITSKVTLTQFLEKEITKKRFLRLLTSICEASEGLKNYMIDPYAVIFDMDNMFVDVSTSKTYIVVNPVASAYPKPNYNKFFKQILMSTSCNMSEDTSYFTKIHNYLNINKDISLNEFFKFLESIGGAEEVSAFSSVPVQPAAEAPAAMFAGSQTNQSAAAAVNTGISNNAGNSTNSGFNVQNNMPVNDIPSGNSFGGAIPASGGINIPGQPAAAQPQIPEEHNDKKGGFFGLGKKNKKSKDKTEPAPSGFAIPGQAPASMGGVAIPGQPAAPINGTPVPAQTPVPEPAPSGKFRSGKRKAEQNIESGAPIPAANNQSVMPSGSMGFPGAQNTIPQGNMQGSLPMNNGMGGMLNTVPAGQNTGFGGGMNIAAPVQPNSQYEVNTNAANYGGFDDDDDEPATMLLGVDAAAGEPMLRRMSSNETIPVNKDKFVLGKEKNFADYCVTGNPAVSRSHAFIIKKGDLYYIVDTNSKNHTYVNGKMIPSNQEILLNSNDIIKLANEEFMFTL